MHSVPYKSASLSNCTRYKEIQCSVVDHIEPNGRHLPMCVCCAARCSSCSEGTLTCRAIVNGFATAFLQTTEIGLVSSTEARKDLKTIIRTIPSFLVACSATFLELESSNCNAAGQASHARSGCSTATSGSRGKAKKNLTRHNVRPCLCQLYSIT